MPFVKPSPTPRHSFVLDGPSGSGKTFQFAQLESEGFVGAYATIEQKSGTIAHLLNEYNNFVIKNPFFPLNKAEKADKTKPSDLIVLYDLLRGKDHPFDFLFLDSGMFYSTAVKNMLVEAGLSGRDLWGAFADRMEKFLEVTASLVSPIHPKPVDVFVTWGVEKDKSWDGKLTTQPLMDGARTKPRLPYYFDNVFYLESRLRAEDGLKEWVLHTQGTEGFDAKVSAPPGTLLPVIVNPNMGKILKTLHTSPPPAESMKDQHIGHLNAVDTEKETPNG